MVNIARQRNNIDVYHDEWVNDIGDWVETTVGETPETRGGGISATLMTSVIKCVITVINDSWLSRCGSVFSKSMAGEGWSEGAQSGRWETCP